MQPPVPKDSARTPANVLVIENLPIVRAGISGWASRHFGVRATHEAATLSEAQTVIAQRLPVAIIAGMASLTVVADVAALITAAPWANVMLICEFQNRETINDVLSLGVRACVAPSVEEGIFTRALQSLSRKLEVFIDPAFARKFASSKVRHDTASVIEQLTQRERQVMALIATGMSNKEISNTLNLSPTTVKRHFFCAREKLGANNRVDAVNIFMAQKASEGEASPP